MKKGLAMVLTLVMLSTATPAYAADLSEEFSGPAEEHYTEQTIDFTDMESALESAAEDVFADGPVEELPDEQPQLAAQSLYDVSVTGTLVRSEVQEFVRLLNQEREAMGRPPVKLDQEMMEIAEARAAEGSLLYNHIRPDGSSAFQWWDEAAQLKPASMANAAYLLESWKNSAAHWNGLTESKHDRFGLGIFNQGTGICSVYACMFSDAAAAGHPYIPYQGLLDDITKTYNFKAGNQYIDFAQQESFDIQIGSTVSLRPKYYVWFAYDPNYFGYFNNDNGTWISEDPSVAAIDAQGNLTGIKAGSTTIHFYLNGDKDKSYDAVVAVAGEQLPVTIKGNYIYRGSEKQYGWVHDGDSTYYTDPSSGKIQQGFVQVDGKEYFFVPVFFDEYEIGGTDETFAACTMLSNVTVTINGKWYQFFADGTFKAIAEPVPVTPTPAPSVTPSPKPEVTPTPVPDTTKAPSVPNFKITASGQYAKMAWNRPKGAAGYQIYKYNVKTKKYDRFKTLTKGSPLTYNTKLGLAKTGTFKIRAFALKADGKSRVYGKFSSAIKIKTAPGKPSFTSITSKSKGKATLKWKQTSGAEGYQIYRCATKNGKYVRVKTITAGKTMSYINTKLKSGKRYYYKLRAYRTNTSGRVYGSFSDVTGVLIK